MAFDADDLSPHEHFVAERTRAGEVADFSPLGAADGGKPSIRAGFLRRLMLGLDSSWSVRAPGVRIKGARLEGALDLTDCSELPALSLDSCDAPDTINLNRASIARLALTRCRLHAVLARDARIGGDIDLSAAEPLGPAGAETLCVDISGATIAAAARFSSTKLARGELESHALKLDASAIGGDLLFDNGFEAFGAISMQRTRVGGSLSCASAALLNRTDDATGAALAAHGARIDGDVALSDLKAEGVLYFSGARIGGTVSLEGTKLRNEFGNALALDHARVAGTITGAAKIAGQFSARAANVGRDLDLRGCEIVHPLTPRGDTFGIALAATSAKIGGDLLLQGVNIKGEVSLANSCISGHAIFGGGRFINGGAWAIRASSIKIDGNLLLKIDDSGYAPHGHKTVIEGGAKFEHARIKGSLVWSNLELRGPGAEGAKGALLTFAESEIGGALHARALVTHQHAQIDISGARCMALDDDIKTAWGVDSTTLGLDGFLYQRIESADETRRARLAWLKRMERFSPQPYTQLARSYARAGKRGDARKILLTQRDMQTARASAGPITWALSSLFGVIAGYGLSPVRIARALVLFLALGISGVLAMNAQGALVRPDGNACNGAVSPALYAIDVAIPVIDLSQASACAPGRTARAQLPQGIALGESDWRLFEGLALWRWAHGLYAIFGAILVALGVLTLSGALKPREP